MFLTETQGSPFREPQVKPATNSLSWAIRQGSKLRGQCWDSWATGGRSCALTAAAEATGLQYRDNLHSGPIIAHLQRKFPDVPADLYRQIVRWNDAQLMTREQVADRLESQGL